MRLKFVYFLYVCTIRKSRFLFFIAGLRLSGLTGPTCVRISAVFVLKEFKVFKQDFGLKVYERASIHDIVLFVRKCPKRSKNKLAINVNMKEPDKQDL